MAEQQTSNLFDLDALKIEGTPSLSDPFFQEEAEVPDDGEKYVVFEVNKKNYAVPSECVAEVVRMLPVTEIPNIPGWFLGIANLRGDILSVIDLSGFLNNESQNPSSKSKLIVLASENSETNLAFKVDRLREIVILTDDQIELPASDQNDRHLAGVASYKSHDLNVLDVRDIISSLAIR